MLYNSVLFNIIANKMKSLPNNLFAVLCLSFIALGLSQISVDDVKVSHRRVSANGVSGITTSDNLDFDTAITDNTIWWDSTNKQWTVEEDGLYQLSAVVTFDQNNTPDFPTSNVYDHQVHAFINGNLPTDVFLDIFTTKGNGNDTWQQRLAGTGSYNLSLGDTVAVRIQTRIYPTNIVNSTIDGGDFALTQATLRYLGKL